MPAYLQRLEDEAPEPVDAATDELLTALRGDCHSHTDASDGGSPLDEMAATARGLGHEYLVVTDHSPRLTVANGLSAAAAAGAARPGRGAERGPRRAGSGC